MTESPKGSHVRLLCIPSSVRNYLKASVLPLLKRLRSWRMLLTLHWERVPFINWLPTNTISRSIRQVFFFSLLWTLACDMGALRYRFSDFSRWLETDQPDIQIEETVPLLHTWWRPLEPVRSWIGVHKTAKFFPQKKNKGSTCDGGVIGMWVYVPFRSMVALTAHSLQNLNSLT